MEKAIPVPSLPVPEKDQALFKSINEYVYAYMSNYDCSHDYSHILRVLSNANLILQSETRANPERKFDNTLLFLAALLHDVGDHKYAKEGDDVENQVLNMLRRHGVSDELALKVQTIVKHVGWSHEIKDPEAVVRVLQELPELAVVQDADRLDAIGAIGVGRCFTFTGAKCPANSMSDAVAHFEEKLVKLAGAMKTETGKAMAESRHKFIREFADQFYREAELSFSLQ